MKNHLAREHGIGHVEAVRVDFFIYNIFQDKRSYRSFSYVLIGTEIVRSVRYFILRLRTFSSRLVRIQDNWDPACLSLMLSQ